MMLDRPSPALLARHRADERQERDAVKVNLAVHDRAGRQDVRKMLCEEWQAAALLLLRTVLPGTGSALFRVSSRAGRSPSDCVSGAWWHHSLYLRRLHRAAKSENL